MFASTHAKNLGTIGPVYEIAEQDMEEYIQNKLASLDLEETMQNVIEKTKEQLIPAGITLSRVEKERVFYLDPTRTLEEDIVDEKGNILHHKGFRYNSLDYTPFTRMYLFIDGDDPDQLELANRYEDAFRHHVQVLLVNGDIFETMKENEELDIFYADKRLIKGFQITRVPSLVSQDGNMVKVKELVW